MSGVPGPRGGPVPRTSGRRPGIVDREVWRKAGAAGLLGMDVDEEYGGGGQRDFRFNAVLVEEIVRAGCSGLGFGLHNDVVAPYLTELTTDGAAQAVAARLLLRRHHHRDRDERAGRRLRPGRRSHDRGARRRRRRSSTDRRRSSPTASMADLVIVVAKTAPDQGAHGVSLIAVERGTPGFTRGRRLEKVGLQGQRHRRAVLRRLPGAGRQPHRHREPRLLPPDGATCPGSGSASRSPRWRRPRRSAGDDAGVRAHPGGVRPADRHASSTTGSCSPSSTPR